MINLKNKKVIITGGSRGIGLCNFKKFRKNGCKILTTGTNEQKLE